MPTGVYPRNKLLPNLFQKGFTPWNKGKPHMQGKNHPMWGKHSIPWNKGKKGLQEAWNKKEKVIILCKNCNKEFKALESSKRKFCLYKCYWNHKRKRIETNKRWNERQYCDNICRSKALKEQKPEDNYFYGKSLTPWNKKSHYGKGWRQYDGKGYIRVYKANGDWEYEHRLVAKKALGILSDDEVVHHINFKKDDNRLDNLLVCLKSEHKKYHAGSITQRSA